MPTKPRVTITIEDETEIIIEKAQSNKAGAISHVLQRPENLAILGDIDIKEAEDIWCKMMFRKLLKYITRHSDELAGEIRDEMLESWREVVEAKEEEDE